MAALSLHAVAGCGGDDDGGDNGGGGDVTCTGSVSGAVTGDFSDCIFTIVQYPDGAMDRDENYWLFSLSASPLTGSTLDPSIESLGTTVVVAGDPAATGYALADTLPETLGFLFTTADIQYEDITAIDLQMDELTQAVDDVMDGVHYVSFFVHGSLDITLDDGTGRTVTASASF
jgi:hypothetical protein